MESGGGPDAVYQLLGRLRHARYRPRAALDKHGGAERCEHARPGADPDQKRGTGRPLSQGRLGPGRRLLPRRFRLRHARDRGQRRLHDGARKDPYRRPGPGRGLPHQPGRPGLQHVHEVCAVGTVAQAAVHTI